MKIINISAFRIGDEFIKFNSCNIVVTEDRGFKTWTVNVNGLEKVLEMEDEHYNLIMISNEDKEYRGKASVTRQIITGRINADTTFRGSGALTGN